MSDPEIILNLWYVVDDLGYIYSLRARAYLGSGSDDEKLAMLQKYAKTDYLIAKAFPIPKQFHINGQPIYHKSALDMLASKADLFEEVFKSMNDELPAQTRLDIPQSPLICITPLFGDDHNNIRPFNTNHDE